MLLLTRAFRVFSVNGWLVTGDWCCHRICVANTNHRTTTSDLLTTNQMQIKTGVAFSIVSANKPALW